MGTTANRAIPYPADTDLVTNGAAAMQALAEKVDTELGPECRFAAYLPANQSVPTAVWTALTGMTEIADPGGNLSAGVFTAPVAGFYLVTANAFWQSSTTGARYLALWRAANGSSTYAEIPGVAQTAPSGLDPRQNVSGLLHLNAGDKIKPQVFHTAGANLNVIGAADYGVDNAARFAGILLAVD
jgi:hypothetical protein